jgi:hypothetical protein
MAWLKISGSSNPFNQRFPVCVNASTLVSSTNKDVQVTIPKTLELFWESIGSDGYDIRVTDADGITLVDHAWGSWNYTARTGVLEIYGASGTNTWEATQSSMPLLWIYVGDADAGDAAATATLTSALDGFLSPERPAEIIVVSDPTPGRQLPDNTRSKSSGDRRGYWFDFRSVLRRGARRYNDRNEWEEIDFVEVSTESGGSAASIEVEASTRFEGSALVRVVVDGGTDGTDYTLIVKATTRIPDDSTGATRQVVEGRLLIQVRDQDDA